MVSRDDSVAGLHASEGDVQEQERLPVEEALDPEQTAGADLPDTSSAEADPADVHEQLLEVPEEDDDYPEE